MIDEEQDIEHKPLPLPAIIGLYVFFSLCACGVGVGVLYLIGQVGANVDEDSFIAAETVAYEVVYNSTAAERSTVERMQLEQLDESTDRYAILMQYQLADGPHLQLVVVANGPDGYEEMPPVNEATVADENLTATARYEPVRFDGDVAVYGRVLNDEIARVTVFWPGESEISAEASLVDGTLLLFRPWNPIDGTGLPANVIAYDENDEVITVLAWPQPEG